MTHPSRTSLVEPREGAPALLGHEKRNSIGYWRTIGRLHLNKIILYYIILYYVCIILYYIVLYILLYYIV